MDVRALLLVVGQDVAGHHQQQGHITNVPIALLDVLGEPILQRVITRLEKLGVGSTAVVSDFDISNVPGLRSRLRPAVRWTFAAGDDLWKSAEQQFVDFAQRGAELAIVIRLGAYSEVDYEELVQFHLDRAARLTEALAPDGERLEIFAISASRRNDAAFLLRHHLQCSREPANRYTSHGYWNPLCNAADLRRLALDGFAGKNAVKPLGQEIRPGVWVAEDARIHHAARVLAPAFVGSRATIRASAVITRGSSIESHAEIDCGSVVENSTILPFNYVGAGLDVSESVVGFEHVESIRRNVSVSIGDSRLISMTPSNATTSTLVSAIELLTYIPKLLARSLLGRGTPASPQSIPEAVATPAAAFSPLPEQVAPDDAAGFSGKLITVTPSEMGSFGSTTRDYGNK